MTILRSSIVLFAVVAAARGQGNIAFSPSSVATADPVRRVLAADLTGTARPDVIALSAGASSVSVFDLDAAAAATVIPAALPPFFGACADMDGDGDADIVTANGPTPLAGAGTLNLIRRTGGVFQTTPYAIPYAAHVHLRDLDQDGDRDVVVGRTILLNDGAGNLSAGPVPAGAPQILELKPGDFDGDGDVDQEDYGEFQLCLKGSMIAQTDPNCADAHLNADEFVDQADFNIFVGCMSGANVLASPPCVP